SSTEVAPRESTTTVARVRVRRQPSLPSNEVCCLSSTRCRPANESGSEFGEGDSVFTHNRTNDRATASAQHRPIFIAVLDQRVEQLTNFVSSNAVASFMVLFAAVRSCPLRTRRSMSSVAILRSALRCSPSCHRRCRSRFPFSCAGRGCVAVRGAAPGGQGRARALLPVFLRPFLLLSSRE
ncbi:hypothetical protein THAOC_24321, partial [Thalassiosira oceanica]